MVTLNVFSDSEDILRIHLGVDGVILSHQLLHRESTQHPTSPTNIASHAFAAKHTLRSGKKKEEELW